MTTTTDEAMEAVAELWPNAPAFTKTELDTWRDAARRYDAEWGTALGRCQSERMASSDPLRRRCRPDLPEVVAMCQAVRGRYKRLEDAVGDGAVGPETPKERGIERIRELRQVIGRRESQAIE